MSKLLRWILCAALLVCALAAIAAGEPSHAIAVGTAAGRVRFISPDDTCEIRIQVIADAGGLIFDSLWKEGNVLDWQPEVPGQPLSTGSYRCVVMIKDAEGQVRNRERVFVARDGKIDLEQPKTPDGLSVVLLVHDSTQGSVVVTRGDLSFRFGDYLNGADREAMRLTADGKLGIGISEPQARLDVDGLIRTTEGIVFPDGSILTSASEPVTVPTGTAATQAWQTGRPGVRLFAPALPVGPPSAKSAMKPRTSVGPQAQFVVDDAGVHVGTSNPDFNLDVMGYVNTQKEFDIGGMRFAHTTGADNVFIGRSSGGVLTTGSMNSTLGADALVSVSAGLRNAAIGYQALQNTTSGYDNVGVGVATIWSSESSNYNTAIGSMAMAGTGVANPCGNSNTAIGFNAGHDCLGSYNISIGAGSGYYLTGTHNIDIDNAGTDADNKTIRIGTGATHLRTFIAGIRGVQTGNQDAINVVIDSNGQLGTLPSSRRYKTDIADMASSTNGLMSLRPVTFRYRGYGPDAALQYGLIAEEVAEVYPELVVRNDKGEPETVLYQFLAPMLLNQVQKLTREVEMLSQRLTALEAAASR